MSESESADALDLDLSRVRSRTPLHKAVGQRRADMVRFLLNAKADINAKEVRRRWRLEQHQYEALSLTYAL